MNITVVQSSLPGTKLKAVARQFGYKLTDDNFLRFFNWTLQFERVELEEQYPSCLNVLLSSDSVLLGGDLCSWKYGLATTLQADKPVEWACFCVRAFEHYGITLWDGWIRVKKQELFYFRST